MNNCVKVILFVGLMIIILFENKKYCYDKNNEIKKENVDESSKGNREYYGGPIKAVRKIPMTDCYGICDYQYKRCLQTRPYYNDDRCEVRQYACKAECYYSNAQCF